MTRITLYLISQSSGEGGLGGYTCPVLSGGGGAPPWLTIIWPKSDRLTILYFTKCQNQTFSENA